MKKRIFTGLVVSGMVFGAVWAMAASLGGLTTDQLASDDATVDACDSDGVTAAWTSEYDPVLGAYEVNKVTIAGIDADCIGGAMDVTLTGTGGSLTSPAEKSVTSVATASHDLDFSALQVRAEDVKDIHVVIDGGATDTTATL